MRETRLSGLEGGVALIRHPYPYRGQGGGAFPRSAGGVPSPFPTANLNGSGEEHPET